MTLQQLDPQAQQRERQARIQQDIRDLFARYRQVGSAKAQRAERPRPARRFARAPQRPTQRAG
jgi:hypothetical protein